MALHSDNQYMKIFSNTAPRGKIKWHGEEGQPFVYVKLDNGMEIFAVDYGYNLSFVKDRIVEFRKIKVLNVKHQFRSRDIYPKAMMTILQGDRSLLGRKLNVDKIPDPPKFHVGSIEGYENIKTTIKKRDLPRKLLDAPILRIQIGPDPQNSYFVLNTLSPQVQRARGARPQIGDLCLVEGSTGGKKEQYLEIIKLTGEAAVKVFRLERVRDDENGEIKISTLPMVVFQSPTNVYSRKRPRKAH